MNSQRTQILENLHSPESSHDEDPKRVQIGLLQIGSEEHKIFEGITTIGSLLTCDICIDDPTRSVSQMHAEILASKEDVFISDLHSANGTYLNGEYLSPKTQFKVEDGASLKFSDVDGKFSLLKSWKESLQNLLKIQNLSLNDPNTTQHPIEPVSEVKNVESKVLCCKCGVRCRKCGVLIPKRQLSVDGNDTEGLEPEPKTSKQSNVETGFSIFAAFGVSMEAIHKRFTVLDQNVYNSLLRDNWKPRFRVCQVPEAKEISDKEDSCTIADDSIEKNLNVNPDTLITDENQQY